MCSAARPNRFQRLQVLRAAARLSVRSERYLDGRLLL